MKKLVISILVPFCLMWGISLGQKPSPIQINSFISRIPLPVSSQVCYESSTTTKDPSSGLISIKDNGPQFNSLNEDMDKISKGDMDAMKTRYANAQSQSASSSAPTPDQVAQMQAEAMQKAQQAAQNAGNPSGTAQTGSYSIPQTTNVALMQELGRAQSSVGQITQLTFELSTKMGQLQMDEVSMGPNCPEVRQGSYVGPTCACTKQHSVDYERKRVEVRDKYLRQVNDLLQQYIPRIKGQVALVDKVEIDSKYGQAVSDPAISQMLWSVQRQAMGGFTSVMGIASSAWKDGASQYLNLVNTHNKTCP